VARAQVEVWTCRPHHLVVLDQTGRLKGTRYCEAGFEIDLVRIEKVTGTGRVCFGIERGWKATELILLAVWECTPLLVMV